MEMEREMENGEKKMAWKMEMWWWKRWNGSGERKILNKVTI